MNLAVTVAYAVALGATVLLLRHVGSAYRTAPARIPARIGPDGRPSKRTIGKSVLWLGPGVLAVLVPVIGVLLWRTPPTDEQTTAMVLVMLVFVEVAWLLAWSTDRQIEIARKMTYRIAPARLLRAVLPLLLTAAAAVIVGAYAGHS